MPGKTLHVVSHTHWDREWYLPVEVQRRRLVKLLDDVLEVIDRDPAFHSFHLDGQTIPIEDYLEIRPGQRERFAAAAAAGKIAVGPHYILQDEFLTSAEAQVRNLLYGMADARAWGPVLMVGYLADAFGHIGQMPAILRGFGIDNAVFGRGLNPLDPDADTPEEAGYHSEVTWRGADGSTVLGIWMANWYANAMDLPREAEALRARLAAIQAGCERFATTPHLLLMNGCDHTPCQLDISHILATARELIDDEIVHSRLDEYVAAVRESVGELETVQGEMRSRYTAGWHVLTNVLSSRLYLKQANWRCQTELEKFVEPLQAIGALVFARDGVRPMDESTAGDRDFRRHLWKKLLENHPHDNICGCSCDAVHRDMEVRFEKVEQGARQLSDELLRALARHVDTRWVPAEAQAVLVYNPFGAEQTGLVTATVDFPEDTELGSVLLRDADGEPVPCWIEEDLSIAWDYWLPDDRFRESFRARRVRISFTATVPAVGYAVYAAHPSPAPEEEPEELPGVLENEYLRVVVHNPGVFDIHDKVTGEAWYDLNVIWYGRDVGNEYDYRAPAEDVRYRLDERAGSGLDEPLGFCQKRPGYQLYEGSAMLFDADAEDPDEIDIDSEGELFDLSFEFRIVLPDGARRVEIRTEIGHEMGANFRLRAHFPTVIHATHADADGQFECVQRPIVPWSGWENPSDCHPCQAFVEVGDATGGLTIANRGLPEYEVLRDGRHTIAVTLLRSVGEIGDWGKFPTPDAYCCRDNLAEYAVIPHGGGDERASHAAARAWNAPLRAVTTGGTGGQLPSRGSFLRLDPPELVLSAVRWAEEREALIVRFYNPYDEPQTARLQNGLGLTTAWRCRLDETRVEPLGEFAETLELAVGAKEIVTVELG